MKTLILAAALAVGTAVSTAPSIAAGNVPNIASVVTARGDTAPKAVRKMQRERARELRTKRRRGGKGRRKTPTARLFRG